MGDKGDEKHGGESDNEGGEKRGEKRNEEKDGDGNEEIISPASYVNHFRFCEAIK